MSSKIQHWIFHSWTTAGTTPGTTPGTVLKVCDHRILLRYICCESCLSKAAHALEAIKAFPVGGGASPNGRYNGYVKNLKAKTLKDLGVANAGGKKNRGQRNQKKKPAAVE